MSVSAAVLIGVSDYSAYDRSVGNPLGTSNLFSPENNLRAAWRMCSALAFRPSDMALLSSPLAPLIDAHPGTYGEATRQQVLDAITALARQLAADDVARGYIHFSGHGGSVAGVGPVLAVADTVVKDGELTGYVSLAEITGILVRHAPGKPVTMVLDACGSGLVPLSQTHGRLQRLREIAHLRDHDILISSTGPFQIGAEVEINGEWFGALSWAVSRAIYQYSRRIEHNLAFYDLSANQLFSRASRLIEGLSLLQAPQLTGDGSALFLSASGIPAITPTNRRRSGGAHGLEVHESESGIINHGNEDAYIVFDVLINGTVVGTMTSTYNTSTHTPYHDYWSINPSTLDGTLGNTLTFRYNRANSNFPAYTSSHSMRAFKVGASGSDFGTYTIGAGATVWCLFSGNDREAYFITYPNGSTKWLVESRGYTGVLFLLDQLPSNNSQGGYMLSAGSQLTMTSIDDSNGSLGNVLLAYNVSSANS